MVAPASDLHQRVESACREETLTIHPKVIRAEATYFFENDETGETSEISGEHLTRDGFTFALPQRRGEIWFYRWSPLTIAPGRRGKERISLPLQ